MMITIGAAAALVIAAPVAAQPYGSASYGPAPPYAQPRGPSPAPAPGFGPPTAGYSYSYAPNPSEGAASVGAYGANTAGIAPMSDQTGGYWNYSDTVPYDTDATARADPNAAGYVSRGCRLAPTGSGADARYVRVCPDGSGKYR
ncbi:hypothetical protein LJR219_001174 [Phenylobacterium sp. LjRoot219]|uniref:hypothetical protein n=1 Tax=Phenylobacterium sp. LjRoot219 TaxID=3342283 RepID=UPI003ECF9B0F